jgi:hypothetical protein
MVDVSQAVGVSMQQSALTEGALHDAAQLKQPAGTAQN